MFVRIRRLMDCHPLVTFLSMALSFAGFSLITLEIFHMLSANLAYLGRDGVMALLDDGALQLAGLVGSVFVALACYLVFKLCERLLVDRFMAR
jgi:hypothetical protein